jgi:hypothetical protein
MIPPIHEVLELLASLPDRQRAEAITRGNDWLCALQDGRAAAGVPAMPFLIGRMFGVLHAARFLCRRSS